MNGGRRRERDLLLVGTCLPDTLRLSAHLGDADLTNSNKNVRSRSGGALGAVREAADHLLLDTCTETTRGRAQVKTRPQNSHVVKLERCAKLTDLSDLMLADRGGERDGATAAFRSSARRLLLLRHGQCGDVCHYCEADERSV